jgi:glutamate dehydrogenase (NADP+)
MLRHAGRGSIAGKRIAVSGSGNVAQYAALKCIELGATVVSLSDSKGSLIAEGDGGFTPKQIHVIAELKVERKALTDFPQCNGYTNGLTNGLTNGVNGDTNGDTNGDHEPCGFRWVPGARPWEHVGKVDIALPCATQNEVSGDEARALVAGGVLIVAEGSNMGCTQDAIDVFEAERRKKGDKAVWYAPGKASNCGGVAVSGLEMAQNNQRLTWTAEKVDERLQDIMKRAFDDGLDAAGKYVNSKEGELPSLVAGSNIAGFVKVAQAMHDQGEWW